MGSRSLDHPGCDGFAHDGLLYGSDEELLDLVVPFLADGARSGEPTVVSLGATNSALIRGALGQVNGLSFVPLRDDLRPATAIHQWLNRFEALVARSASPIRVVGEVPHADTDWGGWARYEAAMNHVFDALPVWTLCAYDTRRAQPEVLVDVQRTHPRIVSRSGAPYPNASYEDPVSFLTAPKSTGCHLVQPSAPAAVLFDPTTHDARGAADSAAHVAGLTRVQREDLALVLTELITNAVWHGLPPVIVELWTKPGVVIAAVTDSGPGPDDPFVGLVPVPSTAPGGRGLWIAHQICNDLSLTASAEGFTARLAIGAPRNP